MRCDDDDLLKNHNTTILAKNPGKIYLKVSQIQKKVSDLLSRKWIGKKRFNLAKRWDILVEGVCLECIVYLVIKWPIDISKYLRANFSFTHYNLHIF